MDNDQEKFLQDQAKTSIGKKWLGLLNSLVDQLYSSRGKTLEQVAQDQHSAKFIEKELIERLNVASQPLHPQKMSDYV